MRRVRLLPGRVYVEQGDHDWPLVAQDSEDLTSRLEEGGHLVSLPKESAALANVIEVALVDFLLASLEALPGATGRRGEERSYPDLDIGGEVFGGGFHAVDIKMARLAKSGRQTQSRCTLYTGNTYFKWPTIRWPGMFRPFDDYVSHIDIVGIYRLDVDYRGRVRELEPFVHAAGLRVGTARGGLGSPACRRRLDGHVMVIDLLSPARFGGGGSPRRVRQYLFSCVQ